MKDLATTTSERNPKKILTRLTGFLLINLILVVVLAACGSTATPLAAATASTTTVAATTTQATNIPVDTTVAESTAASSASSSTTTVAPTIDSTPAGVTATTEGDTTVATTTINDTTTVPATTTAPVAAPATTTVKPVATTTKSGSDSSSVQTIVINETDNGKTIQAHIGDKIVAGFNPNLDWSFQFVTNSGSNVLAVPTKAGNGSTFTVQNPGSVTIKAESHCHQVVGKPCFNAIVVYNITVVVS